MGAGAGGWGQALQYLQTHPTPWIPFGNENPPPRYRLGKNLWLKKNTLTKYQKSSIALNIVGTETERRSRGMEFAK